MGRIICIKNTVRSLPLSPSLPSRHSLSYNTVFTSGDLSRSKQARLPFRAYRHCSGAEVELSLKARKCPLGSFLLSFASAASLLVPQSKGSKAANKFSRNKNNTTDAANANAASGKHNTAGRRTGRIRMEVCLRGRCPSVRGPSLHPSVPVRTTL